MDYTVAPGVLLLYDKLGPEGKLLSEEPVWWVIDPTGFHAKYLRDFEQACAYAAWRTSLLQSHTEDARAELPCQVIAGPS